MEPSVKTDMEPKVKTGSEPTGPQRPQAARSGFPRLLLGIAVGASLGAGGMYLARPPHAHEHGDAAIAAAGAQRYQCPMHPTYTSDRPGDCPVCGMKLIPIEGGGSAGSEPPGAGKRKIAFYRSPMNPTQTSTVQRKDEMGMDFVAVYEDEVTGATPVEGLASIKIDSDRQQLIGLRTAEVSSGQTSSDWRTVGRIAVDETRVRKVNVKVDGFVETLSVDFVGKQVRRGQPLLTIYSPELLSVQSEYLLALRTQKAISGSPDLALSGGDLVASARRRLELWDIPRTEIDRLEQTQTPRRTLTLYSPISGVVTVKNVVQGSKLSAGDTPFEITDLSQVWAQAEAHESDLSRVRLGMPVTMTLKALANRAVEGRVAFIDPVLDPRTRTAKVRLVFKNPRGELRPEMYGEVVFHTRERQGIRVPSDAVLDSGDRKVVFVALGEGRFEPREITTGDSAGDELEVRSGLKAGEKVVVRANFLVDSESRLKAALAAMSAKPAQEKKPQAPAAVGDKP